MGSGAATDNPLEFQDVSWQNMLRSHDEPLERVMRPPAKAHRAGASNVDWTCPGEMEGRLRMEDAASFPAME